MRQLEQHVKYVGNTKYEGVSRCKECIDSKRYPGGKQTKYYKQARYKERRENWIQYPTAENNYLGGLTAVLHTIDEITSLPVQIPMYIGRNGNLETLQPKSYLYELYQVPKPIPSLYTKDGVSYPIVFN